MFIVETELPFSKRTAFIAIVGDEVTLYFAPKMIFFRLSYNFQSRWLAMFRLHGASLYCI